MEGKEIDQQKIAENISKTGYELEYKVSRELESNGWIVINSKYYVDDESERVREVDIVAYKSTNVEDIRVYTALIISCKKSTKNNWGILSKSRNKEDPNINWEPVDNWTNSKELLYFFNQKDWKKDYLKANKILERQVFKAENQIFAFQELDKKSFKVRNDKAIYSSITSLIKAMGYEMSNLPNRRNDIKCIYNFNLISIVDTSLINIHFSDNGIESNFTKDEKYIGSYIVNKEETFSRIHFISWGYFKEKIEAYNKLHSHNIGYVKKKFKVFYDEVFIDNEKCQVFKKQFEDDLAQSITIIGNNEGQFEPRDFHFIDFVKKEGMLKIQIDGNGYDQEYIDKLNSSKSMKEEVTNYLNEYYRYTGSWKFEAWLPF